MPSRKVTIIAAIVLALGAAGAAAAYLLVLKKPGDISNPDVPFIDAEPTPGPKAKKAKPQKPSKFRWPRYGFTKDHNRNFEPAKPIRGPFRAKWKHKATALTEFPPAISQGRILQLSDDARISLIILVIDVIVIIDILKSNKDTERKILWIVAVVFPADTGTSALLFLWKK